MYIHIYIHSYFHFHVYTYMLTCKYIKYIVTILKRLRVDPRSRKIQRRCARERNGRARALRVVHVGRSTCHAISGRKDESIRTPDVSIMKLARVLGFALHVYGFGFRVDGSGFRVPGVGCRVLKFGFRITGFGFQSTSSGSDSGSMVEGLRFQVKG